MKIGKILASLMCILLAGLSAGCKVVPKPASLGDPKSYGIKSIDKLFPFGDRPVSLQQDMLVELCFFNRTTDTLHLISEELPNWGGVVPPDKEVEFRTYFPVGMNQLQFFVIDDQNRLLCTTLLYRNSHSVGYRSHYERWLPTLLPPPDEGPVGNGYPNPPGSWVGVMDIVPPPPHPTSTTMPSSISVPSAGPPAPLASASSAAPAAAIDATVAPADPPTFVPMTPISTNRRIIVRPRPAGSGYNVVVGDFKIIGGGVVIGSSTNEGGRVQFGR